MRLSLSEVFAQLPQAVRHLSLERAQILVDQIRSALDQGRGEQLIAVAVVDEALPSTPEHAAFSIILPHSGTDSAALLMSVPAERFHHASAEVRREILRRLAEETDRWLHSAGVRFLQWATDPMTPANPIDAGSSDFTSILGSWVESFASPGAPGSPQVAVGPEGPVGHVNAETPGSLVAGPQGWAEMLGMQCLATLEYHTLDLSQKTPGRGEVQAVDVNAGDVNAGELGEAAAMAQLVPVDWNDEGHWERLVDVVERTYCDTLDCPVLSQFRSAEQILCGYREAAAFEPRLWYLLAEVDGDRTFRGAVRGSGGGEAATFGHVVRDRGVLILGRHRAVTPGGPFEQVDELIYMGLVPEVRGRGWGRRLVAEAIRRSVAAGASRMILAVDERNWPAKKRYHELGFRVVMRETVFAKSLHAASVTDDLVIS